MSRIISGNEMKKSTQFLVTTLICSSLVAPAFAGPEKLAQSHDQIRDRVSQFVHDELSDEDDLDVQVKRLDRRLNLPVCETDLDTFWPPGARRSGNVSVGISCEGVKPWKIYVQVSILVLRDVAILNRPAVKGEVLDKTMVRFEKRDVSRAGSTYLNNVDQLVGYRFRRSSAAGKVLQPKMLEVPLLVERGSRVTIIAEMNSLTVRMKGEAMTDGSLGKVIRVKNLSSNRVVQGEIIAKGIVKIFN